MKKYKIELTRDQLVLVSNCLEDISRFAGGQTELRYTIEEILKDKEHKCFMYRRGAAESHLKQLKQVLLPELRENEYLSYNSTEFIGNVYQVYRSILHHLAKEEEWNDVYSSPPLPSGTMGCVNIETVGK